MDDLQTLWRSAQPAADTQALPDQQIDQMIHRKSRSTFEEFRRTVFWEMLFNVLFTIGCAYYVMTSAFRAFPISMGATFVVLAGFLVWQFRFYQRLRRHPFDTDVRQYLQSALALLRKYVLHYKIMYGITMPISLVLGFIIGFTASKEGVALPLVQLPTNPWLAWLWVIGASCLVFLVIYLLIKYLYQHKINRLQQLVDELEAVS